MLVMRTYLLLLVRIVLSTIAGHGTSSYELAGRLAIADAILDKNWTTGWVDAGDTSQVTVNSALTTRRSFEAEGTRLELATGCPAPHFQCGR